MLRPDQDLIVGIDPSLTNTGLYLMSDENECLGIHNGKNALTGWKKLSAHDRNSPTGQVQRLGLLSQWLSNSITEVLPVDFTGSIHVGYESYSYDSINRAFLLGELGGILKVTVMQINASTVTLSLVPPTVVKKFATGHGNSNGKTLLMDAAKAEEPAIRGLAKVKCTDDVCDAYWLSKIAWYRNCPEKVIQKENTLHRLRSRIELAKNL